MTPQEYVNKMTGRAVDMDGANGVQCWDLWAHFCQTVGSAIIYCGGDGYVDNLWYNREWNGVTDKFNIVTSNFKIGDWLIFGRSGDTQYSHVAMLVGGGQGVVSIFGQNQRGFGGDPSACTTTISSSSLLGGFRLKSWNDANFGDIDIPSGGLGGANYLKLTCIGGLVISGEWIHDSTIPDSGSNSFPGTSELIYTAEKFRQLGKVTWGDYTWTWYSELVLPGGGLDIPGRHVDKNGYICDKKDRICLAGSVEQKKAGTVVATPFGKDGKVYDVCPEGTMDVYVHW